MVRALFVDGKGKIKRATGIFLSVALLFSWGGGCLPVRAVHTETADSAEILLAGLLACDEVIDLSACAISGTDLGQVYADLLYGHPELFHVALRLSFASREATFGGESVRLVTEVYPSYTLAGEELAAARALYRDTVTAILSEMDATFGNRPRTEAETVLYLHDILADRYAYDTRPEGTANANVYTFFRDGVGICQAYALTFLALARGAGLEADFVSSGSMDHAWNHVRVDGVWYHVDVTRDDPIPASEGNEEVNHHRILRSDAGMEALGYYNYTCAAGHNCTDTRYEDDGEAVLGGFHAPLTVFGAYWVGTSEGGAPVAVAVGKDGMTVGLVGDPDGDGEVTPGDLLAVYDPVYPEAWREWLRGWLTKGTQPSG